MTALFAAARVPTVLIGRQEEMDRIHRAIFEPGRETRVICLIGDGGLGKTRMLHEIWQAVTNLHDGDERVTPGPGIGRPNVDVHRPIVSELLDLEPVRLSTTIHFLSALVDSIDARGGQFRRFREARLRHRNALVYQSSFEQIQTTLQQTYDAFVLDYEQIASQRRVVWLLDTAERFTVPVPPEYAQMAQMAVMETTDTVSQPSSVTTFALDWLRTLMVEQPKWLANTTIIMAGRREPNWWTIFDGLEHEYNVALRIVPLTPQEIVSYFLRLSADLKNEIGEKPISSAQRGATKSFLRFTNLDDARVLWSYTGGQPVRLALFADLLVDGIEEPAEFSYTWETVQTQLGWDEPSQSFDEESLSMIQHQLENHFINALFDNLADLRAQILWTLARVRHPLDAKTLEFLIFGAPNQHFHDWESKPDNLRRIEDELTTLEGMSFFKQRLRFGADIRSDEKPNRLVFLQDVIYEIVDNHFSTAPNNDAEIIVRRRLYEKLVEVMNCRIREFEATLQEAWIDDRSRILMDTGHQSIRLGELSPLQALQIRFTELPTTPASQQQKSNIHSRVRTDLEEVLLDRLFYLLRIDPLTALNGSYYELADSAWLEQDEDFMSQAENQLWRFLNDDNLRRLVAVGQEATWNRLIRVARQDLAIRWIKRLHLRGLYKTAIAYADMLRDYSQQFQAGSPEHHSWTHTVTQKEISVYQNYSRTYLAGQAIDAAKELDTIASALCRALNKGEPEKGLEPYVRKGQPDHPATSRVKRVIGAAYFALGYARASLGNFQNSLEAYTTALPYLRETRFESLQVYCQFNMSRAFAENGRTHRAERSCEDALDLLVSRGRGGTRPFALALNTLALSHNAAREPEKAWKEAALAHACFERLESKRGLGLAKLQLGEALRRLADTFDTALYKRNRETPRELYVLSESVLRSAYNIFADDPTVSQETLRRVEAAIELGSSLRDQVRILSQRSPEQTKLAKQLLAEADELFREAANLADQINHDLLYIDALWGIATVNYSKVKMKLGPLDQQESTDEFYAIIEAAKDRKLLVQESVICPDNKQPVPGESQSRALRRVARIHGMIGRIHGEAFEQIAEGIRTKEGMVPCVLVDDSKRKQIHEAILKDEQAKMHLFELARHFSIASGYAELYAPRSILISMLFDDLFRQIRGFNDVLMQAFADALAIARDEYHLEGIRPLVLENTSAWLEASFGYKPVHSVQFSDER